ncbi:MAG: VPLPA-CTERM sorting domain-containing protein [Thermodesulfobacteriota bacterium]|nr:VPLPA-CTERM sorting domain-containing protein [Thermodesulfobacteriota bacterium]
MKKMFVGVACLCLLLVAANAGASVIFQVTLPDFTSTYHGAEDFPGNYWEDVGTFDFSAELGSYSAISATLSGVWGNGYDSTSAHHDLYLDGVFVGTTPSHGGGSDYTAGSDPYWYYFVPFSFTLSDVSILQDGFALLSEDQWSEWNVNLSGLTLTVEAVPVPAAVWLLGSGLLGLVGLRRKFSS